MKYTDGVDALERATEKLAPLRTPHSAEDEVFRALPNDRTKSGLSRESELLRAHAYLYNRYSKAAERRRTKDSRYTALTGATSGGGMFVGLPALLAEDGKSDGVGEFLVQLSGLLGVMGSLGICLYVLILYSEARARRSSKVVGPWINYLDTEDLSGFVVVVNPDEATALALDRAKAHTLTAKGPALVRARQHYYDLLVEVANGTAGTSSGAREEQWRNTWARWCAVDDAWTDLVCDPLSALTHAELLDVTLPRTGAFVTAFAEAREVMTGRTAATVPADLSRLIRAVNTVETAWVEAVEHAEHVGYSWLPEAERKLAAKAEKALTLAGDTNASMGERANAAQAAARLLAQIGTVRLPEKARMELDHLARKALPTGSTSGSILTSAPDRQTVTTSGRVSA